MTDDLHKRMRAISAAGILAGFYEGCSLREIYELTVVNYETILGILEDPKTAAGIAALMDLPVEKTRDIAESLIARMLFNRHSDPFVSLGLKQDVSLQDAHQRWKRLLTLFHPDRHGGSKMHAEKSKRINEAFAHINRKRTVEMPDMEGGVRNSEEFNSPGMRKEKSRIHNFK